MKGNEALIKVKTPGKLYVAGEYAVVEPGSPAILVAVNQCITITIQKQNASFGVIHSEQYPNQDLKWFRRGNVIEIKDNKTPFDYVLKAMKVTEEYLRENNVEPIYYDLNISSNLDNANGKKYGLGSSAAVTVATVKAICKLYGMAVSKEILFKLAAIAHFTVQGNGSLGDVAASAYGGWLAYSSFDRSWLKEELKTTPITVIINQQWPKLKIQPLTPPANLELLVGWTGSTASTAKMVNKIAMQDLKKTSQYQDFIKESRKCVDQMIAGFKDQDLAEIQTQVKINRRLLNKLANLANMEIETKCLNQLCQIALANGAVGKSSGAGGGDCGIVITNEAKDNAEIKKAWQSHKILPLPFKVYQSV